MICDRKLTAILFEFEESFPFRMMDPKFISSTQTSYSITDTFQVIEFKLLSLYMGL